MSMKRGKIKNKAWIFLILCLAAAVFSSIITTAEVNVKDISLGTNYFGGENIKGGMNLSLTDVPYDTLVSGFNNNVLLLSFLKNNNLKDKAGFSCSVVNCSIGYAVAETLSDPISLSEGMSALVGFKIFSSDKIQGISNFLLNISTNAESSCPESMQVLPPLKIDILDDNSSEWTAKGSSYDTGSIPCGGKNYGCYDYSKANDETAQITTNLYCEKINVGPGAGIKIGADINCLGNANFTVNLLNSAKVLQKQWLNVASNETSIIPVYFNSSSESSRDIIVCIKANNDAGICNIGLQKTNNPSCGYSGNTPYDFPIYAQPIAYSAPGQVMLNFANNQNISNYIASRHNNNCSNGCIIPIKIISNKPQTLTINSMEIKYSSADILRTNSTVYKLTTTPTLISMNFTSLDISKSGLTVPSINGNYTLNFKIGENYYLKSVPIFVSNFPVVEFVFPYETIVFEDTLFSAYSSSGDITGYKWNFGDSSPEQTTLNNSIVHKYSLEGNYTLNITAISSLGQAYSSFQIKVAALSKDNILKLLNKNNENLAVIEAEVNQISTLWLKDYLNAAAGINNTKTKINGFISSINSTENLTEVIAYLHSLSIASSFGISESSSGTFIVNPSKINPSFLKSAGAGNMNSDVDESFYKNAVYGWLINNVDINAEENVYSLFYNGRNEILGSYFKITITPKNGSIGRLFLGINKDSNDIIFKDKQNAKNESQATIIILNGSSSSQEIEFFVKERVNPADIPIYLSPEFSKLDIFSNPKCFIDGKCDSGIGEDAETCPADCKSTIMQITISIIILLVLAFIIYIILQEWYKRRYEDYLFKSKDDLYNIINFISNAEKQSMPKSEIFSKLLAMGWSREQITFAYKKFHGQRTGMYEIPVFKIFEKRKVQLEVDRRRAAGNTGNTAPRPIIMPPRGKFIGSPKISSPQNTNKKI